MANISSPFGQNEWLVEEMYRKFRDDPSSVDPSWHEFLVDYSPEPTSQPAAEPTRVTSPLVAERAAAAAPAGTPPSRPTPRPMYGYAAASASASRLIPFAAPPKTTNSAGVVAQAVASVSWPNPNDWWLVRLLGSITPTERTTIVRLLGQSYLATGMARFLTSIAQQLTFGPGGTTAGSGGAWYPTPQFAGLGAGPAVSASLARAEPVGRLSVPPSWAVAAPAFAEKPEAGTPMSVIGEASSCGQGGLLRGIPLARAGRRTGAFAHRYGFRHSVITRSPSAG